HEGWAGLRPGAAASGRIPASDTVLRLLGALGVCREAVARAIVLGEECDPAGRVDQLRVAAAAHGALAFEHDALVDDEARNADISVHLPRRMDLEPLASGHVPLDGPVDHDGRAVDLRVDDRGLA